MTNSISYIISHRLRHSNGKTKLLIYYSSHNKDLNMYRNISIHPHSFITTLKTTVTSCYALLSPYTVAMLSSSITTMFNLTYNV